MPKKKGRPRSREEQERIFKEAAKASGADVSGKAFESAMTKIFRTRTGASKSSAKSRRS